MKEDLFKVTFPNGEVMMIPKEDVSDGPVKIKKPKGGYKTPDRVFSNSKNFPSISERAKACDEWASKCYRKEDQG